MFAVNQTLKIWRVINHENFTSCQVSSSTKNKKTKEYVTDFTGYVTFVGQAHKNNPQVNDIVKIKSCGVTSKYDKEKKKGYTNCVVYDYELIQEKQNNDGVETLANIINDDDDIPF